MEFRDLVDHEYGGRSDEAVAIRRDGVPVAIVRGNEFCDIEQLVERLDAAILRSRQTGARFWEPDREWLEETAERCRLEELADSNPWPCVREDDEGRECRPVVDEVEKWDCGCVHLLVRHSCGIPHRHWVNHDCRPAERCQRPHMIEARRREHQRELDEYAAEMRSDADRDERLTSKGGAA